MAPPQSKKRKVSHSPSDSEGDDVSFASLGSDELDMVEEDAFDSDGSNGIDGEEEAPDSDAGEDDESDEGEDDSAGKEDDGSKGAGTKSKGRQMEKTEKIGAKPKQERGATAVGGGAYTSGTFKSNMFKLQVDEMLSHVRAKHGKREAAAEAALHKVKEAIEKIPAMGPLPIAEAERKMIKSSRVAVPFPEPRPAHDAKYKLEYAKPANINVVGSYPLKLTTRTSDVLGIDMVVTMPASIFQDKDYLNHRYFYKRSYYLASIASGLQSACSKDFSVRFESLHGNPLQPIIVVEPKSAVNGSLDKWRVNVIPAIPQDTFSDDKVLPSKNCVRPAKTSDADGSPSELPATPFYNSTVQADGQVTAYLKFLHSASTKCEAFKDACLLGRIWLRQRGLSSQLARGGFGNFEFAASMALLLQAGGPSGSALLSPGYSSYQLFKATLQFLATKDLVKQPLSVEAGDVKLISEDGSPVLFDGQRSHNILYKMTAWSYKRLRRESRTTLQMLSDSSSDSFEGTFILRSDNPLQRSDFVTTMPADVIKPDTDADYKNLSQYSKMYAVLSRGLGDRVTEIALQAPLSGTWDIASARPVQGRKIDLVVALTVDPANVSRAVDHGPSAEQKKEAADFRRFWGPKAELRRFRDGSILESLVWSAKEGPSILQQIISYLLERHFGADVSASAVFFGDGFTHLMKHSGTAPFQPVMEAFKTLETDIRGMEEMPLSIRQVMPADAQLRYSTIQVPLEGAAKLMKSPADVVVLFEGSGRWPDDLVAIQRTKIAFLLKIGELFEGSIEGVTARVGLENEGVDILNQAYLDVTYSTTGAAFRLRIHHDREETLLNRILKDKSADPKSRESAATGLAAYKRNYLKAPLHTQAVQKLCTRYPALSPTIRLTKKWFASHLLADHFADEIIELFAIHVFVQPWPWQTPSSAQTGFLRTLSFLARWDWRAEPLIVDLGGDMKAESVQAINTRFEAWRNLDPALNRIALFAASSVDTDGTTFTDGAPALVVAGRMSALARAAAQEVENKGIQLEPASLFVSPLGDYDFVLHMNPEFVEGLAKKNKSSQFKNLATQGTAQAELVGFHPVESFLQELRHLYGHAVVLFYGGKGSKVIAGLWSPQTAKRSWKVNLAYSVLPLKGEGEGSVDAVINKEGILAEMARLGDDLVTKVEMNK